MLFLMVGIFENLTFYNIQIYYLKLFATIKLIGKKMANKIDKETQEHKKFYENFLKFTTYSTIIIIAIVALMAIFLV